jgi:hypothetical protein
MEQNFNANYRPATQYSGGQFPPFTNVIFVDSLEQALRMPSRTHSEMVYWNRHKDELYRIYTDYSYGKQYMVLDVKLHETPKVENLENKDDVNFNTLQEQIRKIQSELEVLNGKYNVKTDAESSTESSTDTAGK